MDITSNGILWFLALVFLTGGNGFGGIFGNRIPMGPPPVTQPEMTAGFNSQMIIDNLHELGIATANNNYETSRLISEQNLFMQNQNNTNLVNIIQGFNNVIQQLQSQTAQLSQQISQIGYQMDQCCCKIQTRMLEDRLADKTAEAVALQNKLDNRDQTQTILNALGRFVAWTPSGSQAASAAG